MEKQRRFIIAGIIVLVLAAAAIVFRDLDEIRALTRAANWLLILPAILFTLISYFLVSYNFALVNRAFNIPIGQVDLVQIGFVSIVLGNILALGGTPQFGLRLLLMRRRGLSTAFIMAPSIFSAYLNSFAMFFLFPVGITYLLLHHTLSAGQMAAVVTVLVLALVGLVLTTLVILRPVLRARLLHMAGRAAYRLTRRNFAAALDSFHANLSDGVAVMHRRPLLLIVLALLIAGDWAASVVAIYFCFSALGLYISFGIFITGFAIGVTAGTLSFLPGGIGIQEGSMAGIYALMGVPFEQALLGAILFRLVYYFIPFVISLAFYRRLLRSIS